MRQRACVVLCLPCLAVTLACATPPNQERAQADGAIAAAHAADAATYAPEHLRAAEDAIAKYDAAVTQRDYRLALSLALEARDGAYEAVRRAGDEKAAARGAAERLIADGLTLATTGAARLKASPRLSTAAADNLRRALAALEVGLQEARAAVSQHDYRGAVARLEPVIADITAPLAAVTPR